MVLVGGRREDQCSLTEYKEGPQKIDCRGGGGRGGHVI